MEPSRGIEEALERACSLYPAERARLEAAAASLHAIANPLLERSFERALRKVFEARTPAEASRRIDVLERVLVTSPGFALLRRPARRRRSRQGPKTARISSSAALRTARIARSFTRGLVAAKCEASSARSAPARGGSPPIRRGLQPGWTAGPLSDVAENAACSSYALRGHRLHDQRRDTQQTTDAGGDAHGASLLSRWLLQRQESRGLVRLSTFRADAGPVRAPQAPRSPGFCPDPASKPPTTAESTLRSTHKN